MVFSLTLIALAGGVVASFMKGNRRLPSAVLLLGLVLVVLSMAGLTDYFGLAGIAILAAIIWSANKAGTRNDRHTTIVKAVCCALSGFVVLGFCLMFFFSPLEHYPLPIPNEGDVAGKSRYFDWQFWTALRQIQLITSPLLSIALLLVALKLGGQLRRLNPYGEEGA